MEVSVPVCYAHLKKKVDLLQLIYQLATYAHLENTTWK